VALKKSKPSYDENHRRPGTLATWTKRHLEAKLKYISQTPFPSQGQGIFPDPRAEEKRLKTFLFYHLRAHITRETDREGEGEED